MAENPKGNGAAGKVLRFRASERRVHWAIAIPFLVCYTTALVLVVVYNPDPLRPYRDVFSWIHRISGVALIVFPTWAIIKSAGDIRVHLFNIRQAWVWVFDDIRWLVLMFFAAITKKVSLPEQGKFNAGQKLNFMLVMSTYPLYIVTGLIMWVTGATLWAWLLHFAMAVIATPFILGHIFMATIPRSTRKGLRGMITGFVDRQWAAHHHARWYRETVLPGDRRVQAAAAAARAAARPTATPKASTRDRTTRVAEQPSGLTSPRQPGSVIYPKGAPLADATVGDNGNGMARAASSSSTIPSSDVGQSRRANGRGDRSEHVLAMLAGFAGSNPGAVRAALLRSGDGEPGSGIRHGRRVLQLCLRSGKPALAADLFTALWPDVRGLDLTPGERHSLIKTLMARGDVGNAAKACALTVLEVGEDTVAVEGLLRVGEVLARRPGGAREAAKIHAFIHKYCPGFILPGRARPRFDEVTSPSPTQVAYSQPYSANRRA